MRDGEPISWRHFVYGTAHLARAYARESVRQASVRRMTAFGLGYTPQQTAEQWMARMNRVAGWEG